MYVIYNICIYLLIICYKFVVLDIFLVVFCFLSVCFLYLVKWRMILGYYFLSKFVFYILLLDLLFSFLCYIWYKIYF